MIRLRLGAIQVAAMQIYVTDPAHDEDRLPGIFYCSLDGQHGRLVIAAADRETAWRRLTDAANSADADADRDACRALSTLASRVLRGSP